MSNNTKAAPERSEFLSHIDAMVDGPLTLLGFVWLVLIVVDLTSGLEGPLLAVTYAIWLLFILDYLLELFIAPDRVAFLRRRWVGLIALLIPGLRVLSLLRAFRLVQSLRVLRAASLARVLTSTNRALASVRAFLGERKLGLVLASSVVVTFAGAAGIFALEGGQQSGNSQMDSFGDALWWAAMMLTTMGSQYWPESAEGRILAWLLALYAFAIFGYITAFLASVFLSSGKSAPLQGPTDGDGRMDEVG